MTPITFESLEHSGIEALCTGSDGNLYGVQSARLFRSTDGGATLELGGTVPGSATNVFHTSAGFVVTTRVVTTNEEEGSIFLFDGFDDPSPATILTTTSDGAWFDAISCSHYQDDDLDLVLCGEYGRRGTEPKNLWISKDGGATFRNAWQTINANTEANSHWHCAVFDPYSDVIWAAHGDGTTNALLWWSEDLGVSWRFSPEPQQPTCVVPLPDRTVFGIDEQWMTTGAYEEVRDEVPHLAGVFTRSFTLVDGLAGPNQYGNPGVWRGERAYIPFPRQIGEGPAKIMGTDDGGATWVEVYSDTAGPQALTWHGDHLYAYLTGRVLHRAAV